MGSFLILLMILWRCITKTCINLTPLNSTLIHFYKVKLRFTRENIIFSNICSPTRFERVPTVYVLSRNRTNVRIFLFENFPFLVVKFSIYLNRHVFVMCSVGSSLCGLVAACCGFFFGFFFFFFFFFFFLLFVVLLLCFVDPVQHCDHLVGEERAGPEVIKLLAQFS